MCIDEETAISCHWLGLGRMLLQKGVKGIMKRKWWLMSVVFMLAVRRG